MDSQQCADFRATNMNKSVEGKCVRAEGRQIRTRESTQLNIDRVPVVGGGEKGRREGRRKNRSC